MGPQGPTGEPGERGPRGQIGPRGERGPKGDKGDAGDQGPQGIKGDRGDQGDTGPAGPSGGQNGDKGDKGDPGDAGPQGEKGDKGDTGDRGPAGTDGAQGPQGEKGDKGDAGDTGPAGNTGPAGLAFDAGIKEPAGSERKYRNRQYGTLIGAILTNLINNPGEYAAGSPWRETDWHSMLHDTTATYVNIYNANKAVANAMSPPMGMIPGLRLLPPGGTAAGWCDKTYWTAFAAKVAIQLSLRADDDPRIDWDIEGYGGGIEASASTLIAAGLTEAQFRTAFQPVIDVLVAATNSHGVSFPPVILLYPHVQVSSANDLPLVTKMLMESIGPHRVVVAWEDSFYMERNYLQKRSTSYTAGLQAMHENEQRIEYYFGFGKLQHAHVVDDDGPYRDWGASWRANQATTFGYGTRRPWVFDNNRGDLATWGTPAMRIGTTLSSVNDVRGSWYFIPGSCSNPESQGAVGLGTTLNQFRGGPINSALGPCCLNPNLANIGDPEGLRLVATPTNPYAVLRTAIMPTASDPLGANVWSFDVSFQLPSTYWLNTTKPILGQCFSNFISWQIYYDSVSNSIKYQAKISASATNEVTLMTAPARDTTIRIMLGRNGNDSWFYKVNTGTHTTFSNGATVGSTSLLVLGGGNTPGTPPVTNTQDSVDHILFVNSFNLWYRFLPSSDTTKVAAKATGWPFGVA
jgi:hypothetical protein